MQKPQSYLSNQPTLDGPFSPFFFLAVKMIFIYIIILDKFLHITFHSDEWGTYPLLHLAVIICNIQVP